MGQPTFVWKAAPGVAVQAVGAGVRLQVTGREYEPDCVEAGGAGTGEFLCTFDAVGLSLRLTVVQTADRLTLSGVMRNHTGAPVAVEQL
ncbi:MAG TPA: hypothetical protein QGH10_20335 [Armatimonadota bacterium]|nr:hypothetical protein [Armatimonadota bacterium]